ncbi:MAG: hypothetical protein IT451_08205 [Candidatus Brocadia sp.]|nr:hypothetical protein [Candidatus Brocadia sp.]
MAKDKQQAEGSTDSGFGVNGRTIDIQIMRLPKSLILPVHPLDPPPAGDKPPAATHASLFGSNSKKR